MNTDLGNNIRTFRKNKGFTQEELADLLSVTPQAVSRWESAGGLPDVSILITLCKILNVSTDALLGYDNIAVNSEIYEKISKTAESMIDQSDRSGSALKICEYMASETNLNPSNYELIKDYVQYVANMSRYEDPFLEDCYKDQKDHIYKLYKDAIRKGTNLISHSHDRILIEKTHYAISWIYIHMKDFDKAREHIEVLPSLSSCRLQEFISMKAVFFESGFEKMKPVIDESNTYLFNAIWGVLYSGLENYAWNGSKEEAVQMCDWCESVIDAFAENKKAVDPASYLRFKEEIAYYKMLALTLHDDRKAAEEYYPIAISKIEGTDFDEELKKKMIDRLNSDIAYYDKFGK